MMNLLSMAELYYVVDVLLNYGRFMRAKSWISAPNWWSVASVYLTLIVFYRCGDAFLTKTCQYFLITAVSTDW